MRTSNSPERLHPALQTSQPLLHFIDLTQLLVNASAGPDDTWVISGVVLAA